MTEQQFQKLNEYLSTCFNELEKEDFYLLINMRKCIFASEKYTQFIRNQNFDEESHSISLTFEEVYALGKEFLENVCPCYLEEYETIMSTGVLDFSYENAYKSCFIYNRKNEKELVGININRVFDYCDVVSLIHEFFHYTNGKSSNLLRYLLTEFISIYFETKAIIYLIEEKQVNPSDVFWYSRLEYTYKDSHVFNQYSFPLAMYLSYWEINTAHLERLLEQIRFWESKETFEKECKNLLERFEKIEKNFQIEHNSECFEKYLINHALMRENYRYLLGTFLAFYAINDCDTIDVVYLNKQITNYQPVSDSYDVLEQDLAQLLKSIGIDINHTDTLYKSMENMQCFIDKYTFIKRR